MSGMARSQVDMSLDDIIKLKKEQKEDTPKKSTTPNRRNVIRTRVLAARPRLQKKLRIQNKTNFSGRSRGQLLRGRQTRRNDKPVTAVSSSAALAVLKRARRTAVEAAKAAAQAAALINRSQIRRREVFDVNRNLRSRVQSAGFRNTVRNNQVGFRPFSGASNRNFNSRSHSVRMLQFRQARRRQRYSMNAVAPPNVPRFQGGQSVRFNQISRATPAFNNYYRRRRPLPPNNPISRQRDRSYYTQYLAERYTAADRAREREYLAQARALIRAQSEQSNQFHNSTQNILGQYSGPPRNRRGRGRGYRRQY